MSEKMNKFEKTRLISARALELAEGAKAKIDISKMGTLLEKDYVKIAEKEYEEGLLDLEIHKLN
jgi:DNA-directed RNA polymerase subunit K/omega